MTDVERRAAAKQFMTDWNNRGDEKQDTQTFWMALLQKVFDVAEPDKYIAFEVPVKLSHTSYIDAYIDGTSVLIEQKGKDIDLKKGYKQSDGSMLTPFQQARRYAGYLPHNKNPRWIVVCNFQEFHIHDMNRPNDEAEIILLKDLEKEYHRLQFLVNTGDENIKKEMEVSLKAGELVGVLYDALLKQYKNPESEETLKSLNALCVRLVFCLYAEDAGIFGGHGKFHDYMQRHKGIDARRALIDLFKVLDTKPEDRDLYMDDDLAAFPYVNGGLFEDENIIIPRLDENIVDLIVQRASEDFDWSVISPTIFGAVFESTLNPETRRSGGMHYTSIENIHKVIDPLFLNELKEEFKAIQEVKVERTRDKKLKEFQIKLAGLTFLDPACGSGNFLTETYISLRRLENEVLKALVEIGKGTLGGQLMLGSTNPIQVSIGQFYGIEINDFAVTVAKTALWIAESQMMKETEDIVHMNLDFLPLKSYANIVEGNALRMDWEDVVAKEELDYIMGNPPFIGARMMEQGGAQKKDVIDVFGNIKDVQDLDYVTCWYKLAAKYIFNTNIRCAFVSTNSVCQGSQVPILWGILLNEFGIVIDFAHQTFKWASESKRSAAVHCVIVGFSYQGGKKEKILYGSDARGIAVNNISPYLTNSPSIYVMAHKDVICEGIPKMSMGNMARDGGNFFLKEDELREVLKQEPELEKWIHPLIGAEEFIKGKKRWCFWLNGITPTEIKNSKILFQRVKAVEAFRLASNAKTTQGYAKTPHLFAQRSQPETTFIVIPVVSSENRRYIPMGFLTPNHIPTTQVQIIPDATLFHFGILTSNVHMAWMRTVAGRLKSDYRYSKEIVYNNFPWCNPTDAQKAKIEQTAQAILDARALYPDSSLADLYDETTMPPELRKAHQMNDKAVWEAYGKAWDIKSESACVAALMKMYQELMEN